MEESESRKPIALFMAFGTKGDVYPLAVISLTLSRFGFWLLLGIDSKSSLFLQAIAAAFARDQQQYSVVLMSHLAHEVGFCFLLSSRVA